MGAALEHAQWTELIGVNEYDHVIGSLLVVNFLVVFDLLLIFLRSHGHSRGVNSREVFFFCHNS